MNTTIFTRLIDALWVLLIVYLTVSSIGVKRDTQRHFLQSAVLTLAILASILLPRLPVFRPLNSSPANPVVGSIGVLLCVAGMAFLVWARQTLGRNWSQIVAAKEGQELITAGPYRIVRHPMYTGGIVACIGSAIVSGAWIFLLIVLGAIFLWRVGAEDKLMERQFPKEYPAYKQRTKALIPFVW
ncbi:MAG TPA: isoprenylcysteine carboxylmethyltransferase family protein [Chloroflexota bacterium]|nr:isoprenylcysteine carboxylmethyltransferase family protein [Chloroflexota bacterium]